MKHLALGGLMALLAMALAGCNGQFEVQQTEPLRIQVDGASETMTVADTDEEPKEVVVETANVSSLDIEVEVKEVDGPCTLTVTVKDEDGATLAEKKVQVGGSNLTPSPSPTASPSATSPPAGGNETGGQTVTQNIVVNVKGKDNVVVITQAQQGQAQVNIAAREAAGNTQGGNGTL